MIVKLILDDFKNCLYACVGNNVWADFESGVDLTSSSTNLMIVSSYLSGSFLTTSQPHSQHRDLKVLWLAKAYCFYFMNVTSDLKIIFYTPGFQSHHLTYFDIECLQSLKIYFWAPPVQPTYGNTSKTLANRLRWEADWLRWLKSRKYIVILILMLKCFCITLRTSQG